MPVKEEAAPTARRAVGPVAVDVVTKDAGLDGFVFAGGRHGYTASA